MADSFLPYLTYLIYGQIILIALAILVGGFSVLRRLIRKQPADGGLILEKERLAAEIHQEILRLTDIRDRLDLSFQRRLEGTGAQAASPVPAMGEGVAEEEVLQRIEAAVTSASDPLNQEIQELKAQLAAAAALEPAPTQAPDTAEATETLKASYETKIEELNNRLQEYGAFEDDLANLKLLKKENEELKQQLAAAPAQDADLTEDDIAGLFAEMGEAAAETEAPETPASDAASLESAPDPTASVDELLASLGNATDENTEDQVFAADAAEPEPEVKTFSAEQPAPADEPAEAQAKGDFEAEALPSEPILEELNEDTAEALAELGGDDELMAEFEKVLSSSPKENT